MEIFYGQDGLAAARDAKSKRESAVLQNVYGSLNRAA